MFGQGACIKEIYGREILDSRGNPTLEAEVRLANGIVGRGVVPSGASTGGHEALELRDQNPARYGGKGVTRAVNNVNTVIAQTITGMNCFQLNEIDAAMLKEDGTKDKSNLGANAILAVSMACAKAGAAAAGQPLYRYLGGIMGCEIPRPMMNILNGGAHAANNVDIQEFMIIPIGAPNFREGVRWCSEVYHKLKGILEGRKMSTAVGDEGGFAPNLKEDTEAIELILTAVELAGYKAPHDFVLALDIAASEWVSEGGYVIPKHNVRHSTGDLIKNWVNLCARYPIASIEDPLGEDDWSGWQRLTADLTEIAQETGTIERPCHIVGDDLFVTNKERLQQGIRMGCANAILIKLNQIGSVTETLDTIRTAQKAGYTTIISHRSGETEDTFIADLSVAVNAKYIKSGAPARSERVAKYNRLIRIEDELI